MPSRRSHSKSRNGCVQCKRARIKVRVNVHDTAEAAVSSNATWQFLPSAISLRQAARNAESQIRNVYTH